MSARLQVAIRFEWDHVATIHNFNFQKGDLVLVRNIAIEKSLNHKMRPRSLLPAKIVILFAVDITKVKCI